MLDDRPPLVPRPDQVEAHDAAISGLDGGIRRLLLVAPMAFGKSVILAMLVLTLLARDLRVLVLAHRRELLAQNLGALQRLDAAVDVGVCSASLKSDNTNARVVIGGTATIYRRVERLGRIDIILIDEAHHLTDGASTMLARIRAALGDPPLVGLTATPFRGDGVSLIESGVFEAIVHEVTIIDALAAGLLRRLVTKSPRAGRIDMSGVRITAGEFNAAEMERAAMAGDTTRLAIERTVKVARAENRRSWLIFSSGVAHARQICAELDRHRISNAVVVGTTDGHERSDVIARFRAGEITALVNCNVFTEGFDVTRIDLVAFLRATCSPVLWVQSAGRGIRNHPGLSDCRLLDFGSNIFRHGPIDNVRLRKPGERHDGSRAAASTRVCPACEEVNPVNAVACSGCGLSFVTVRDVKLDVIESDLAAISERQQPGTWTRVWAMQGTIHRKVGSPPSFRVDYGTDAGEISEFLALQHPSSGARWHASNKWRRLSRDRQMAPPLSALEADARFRSGELRRPVRVLVEREDGWWRVKATDFADLVA
jgi:DNA repair protein RadD